MEKRFTLALVLSLAVLLIWQTWFAPKPTPKKEDAQATEETKDPSSSAGTGRATNLEGVNPEAVDEEVVLPSEASNEILENDVLRLELSNFGGVISKAEFKDHKPRATSEDGVPLQFLSPDSLNFCALRMDDMENPGLRLGRVLWEMKRSGQTVSFKYLADYKVVDAKSDVKILFEKTVTLPEGDSHYADVKFSWSYVGAGDANTTVRRKLGILVSGGVFQEPGGESMNIPRSALFPFEDEIRVVPFSGVDEESKSLKDTLLEGERGGERSRLDEGERFLADLSNYFGAYLILKDFPKDVVGAVFSLDAKDREDQGSKSKRTCSLAILDDDLAKGAKAEYSAVYYLGPIEKQRMSTALSKAVDEEAVTALGSVYDDQLGWARPIAKAVTWALKGFHGIFGNWGWSIIALTFCVRLLLFPINRKSQAAMMKQQESMARVKPKIEALKKKYEGDSRKFAEAQMKMFREEKVSLFPLGGCLPMFLQIPVFFGLFAALKASIDLRQAEWFWVKDLSQPDHLYTFADALPNPLSCVPCCPMPATDITGFHLLPILMTVAWVANSYFMPKPETSNPQMEQQRKMMMFMPLMFGVFMYTYAAGLSLYWLTSSTLGIVESRVIKKIWPIGAAAAKKS